jgi:hypothetical protein
MSAEERIRSKIGKFGWEKHDICLIQKASSYAVKYECEGLQTEIR